MSSVNKFESDMDIDIASLFVGLWRKKGRILLGSLVAAGLAYAYAVTATPKYSAAAKILIQKGESVYTRPTLDKTDDKSDLDQEAIKSQVELIGTSEILKKVASDLDLQQFREFNPVKKMGMLKHALVLLNLVNDPAEIALPDRPLTAMRENLKVYSVENSRFIVVEFSSEDAERAASVANAIAKQYFIVQRDAKKKVNEQATKYLEPQIQELAAKVKEAEAKVASYRSQSDLLIGQNNACLPPSNCLSSPANCSACGPIRQMPPQRPKACAMH